MSLITVQNLIDAAADVTALSQIVNGGAGTITTRLGRILKTLAQLEADMAATAVPGPQGPPGAAGAPGVAGLNGSQVFYQTTAPLAGMAEGDLWVDTSTDLQDGVQRHRYDFYRYTSGQWVSIKSEKLIVASMIAAGAITADKIAGIDVTANNLVVNGTNFTDFFSGAKYVTWGSAGYFSGAARADGDSGNAWASLEQVTYVGVTVWAIHVHIRDRAAAPWNSPAWPVVFTQPSMINALPSCRVTEMAVGTDGFFLGLIDGNQLLVNAQQYDWEVHWLAIGG